MIVQTLILLRTIIYFLGGKNMANLSELDLQNLRHLMGGYDVTHCKMKEYAECASDTKVKQFFEKGAQSAMQNKQQLIDRKSVV